MLQNAYNTTSTSERKGWHTDDGRALTAEEVAYHLSMDRSTGEYYINSGGTRIPVAYGVIPGTTTTTLEYSDMIDRYIGSDIARRMMTEGVQNGTYFTGAEDTISGLIRAREGSMDNVMRSMISERNRAGRLFSNNTAEQMAALEEYYGYSEDKIRTIGFNNLLNQARNSYKESSARNQEVSTYSEWLKLLKQYNPAQYESLKRVLTEYGGFSIDDSGNLTRDEGYYSEAGTFYDTKKLQLSGSAAYSSKTIAARIKDIINGTLSYDDLASNMQTAIEQAIGENNVAALTGSNVDSDIYKQALLAAAQYYIGTTYDRFGLAQNAALLAYGNESEQAQGLSGIKGSFEQYNAAEQAMQKVRAAYESGDAKRWAELDWSPIASFMDLNDTQLKRLSNKANYQDLLESYDLFTSAFSNSYQTAAANYLPNSVFENPTQ